MSCLLRAVGPAAPKSPYAQTSLLGLKLALLSITAAKRFLCYAALNLRPSNVRYLGMAEESLRWFEENKLLCPAAAAVGMAAAAGDLALLQQAASQDCTLNESQIVYVAAAGSFHERLKARKQSMHAIAEEIICSCNSMNHMLVIVLAVLWTQLDPTISS